MSLLNFIGFRNFRVFNIEKGFFAKFAPITLVTGGNNSGKSSILKLLLMMKDSKIFTLSLKGDKHLLGNFDNVLSDKQHKKIILTLPFSIMGLHECFINLHYVPDEKDTCLANLLKIEIHKNDTILISSEYTDATEIEKKQDKKDYDAYFHTQYPEAENDEEGIYDAWYEYDGLVGYVETHINISYFKKCLKNTKDIGSVYLSKLKEEAEKRGSEEPIAIGKKGILRQYESIDKKGLFKDVLKNSNVDCTESFFENILDFKIKELETYLDSIASAFASLNEEKETSEMLISREAFRNDELYSEQQSGTEDIPYCFVYYNLLSVLNKEMQLEIINNENVKQNIFSKSFENIWQKLFSFSQKINYLSSSRGTLSRLYQANSENAFNAIINEYSKHKSHKYFIEKWLGAEGFNIADSIEINARHEFSLNDVRLIIKEGKSIKKVFLVDLGYGVMQVVTLILQISVLAAKNREKYTNTDYYYDSILLVEEPEAHLHPSWQSKLSVMIAEAAEEFNIQFIVETHSEYFIRKFQDLVARKTLVKSSQIKILYLTNPKKLDGDKKQVEEILIEENGNIDFEKFRTGFFDEQYNLRLSLLNTQRDNFISLFEELRAKDVANEEKIKQMELAIDNYTKKQDLSIYENEINSFLGAKKSKMPEKCYNSLVSAKWLLANLQNHNSKMDYSPVIMQCGKILEDELFSFFNSVKSAIAGAITSPRSKPSWGGAKKIGNIYVGGTSAVAVPSFGKFYDNYLNSSRDVGNKHMWDCLAVLTVDETTRTTTDYKHLYNQLSSAFNNVDSVILKKKFLMDIYRMIDLRDMVAHLKLLTKKINLKIAESVMEKTYIFVQKWTLNKK